MATQKKFTADLGLKTDADLQVDGNVTVTGDLTVNGTQTTVNSTTTSVTDSLFELANSNTSSDTLDIGIYGNYDDGLSDGGASEYTGLFRDASDSTWKLFDGLEEEPSTTINTSGTGYTLADLQVGDLTATTLTATNSLTGSSITYPTTDGTNGQVLKTNGSGVLSFGDIPAGYSDSDARSAISVSGDLSYDSSTGVISYSDSDTTYTDSDARSAISGGTGISYDSSTGVITNSSIADGITTSGSNTIIQSPDNTNVIYTNNSAEVGIGTSSPDSKLHIDGNFDGPLVTIHNTGGATSAYAGLEVETSTTGSYVQRWLNAGSELMRVTGTGQVGIGKTPNRSRKLEVAGDINLDNGYGLEWEDGGVGIVGSGATDTMTFSTAGVERMKIHSGGQITASYQPCFMCYPTSSFTASGGSVKYTFASEAFDNQNEYNHTTGRFTAPIAGKYLFMAELALDSSVSALTYAGIGVRVNGSGSVYFGGWGYKADGYSNSSGAHYGKTNSSVILNLAQGDYIELYIELSGSHTVLGGNGGTYTRLMGHLLTA